MGLASIKAARPRTLGPFTNQNVREYIGKMAGTQSKVAKHPAGRGVAAGSAKGGAHNVAEDTKALVDHIAENPLLYAAAAGFVVLCVIAGIFIVFSRQSAARAELTQLGRAVVNDDPALQAAQLEPLSRGPGDIAATAAYLAGEAEIKAQNYAKAEEYLQRVVNEFADSEYAPNAMEALGFLAENRGDYEAALQRYQQINEKWPDSFMARVAPARVGRVLENLDREKEAVDAYCDQFRRFPRSWTTSTAMSAIDSLAKSDNAEVAAAAKEGFKKLSQEFPALFEELYKQYFVPAEEPVAIEQTPVAATTPEQAPETAETVPVVTPTEPVAESPAEQPSEEAAAPESPSEPANEATAGSETPAATDVAPVDSGSEDSAGQQTPQEQSAPSQ